MNVNGDDWCTGPADDSRYVLRPRWIGDRTGPKMKMRNFPSRKYHQHASRLDVTNRLTHRPKIRSRRILPAERIDCDHALTQRLNAHQEKISHQPGVWAGT